MEITGLKETFKLNNIFKRSDISHEILSAFDEVWGLFLDISKTLDKVCHIALIYKLRQNGICEDLINTLNDLLTNRKQKVVLNGPCSSWVDTRAGVPQSKVSQDSLSLQYTTRSFGLI